MGSCMSVDKAQEADTSMSDLHRRRGHRHRVPTLKGTQSLAAPSTAPPAKRSAYLSRYNSDNSSGYFSRASTPSRGSTPVRTFSRAGSNRSELHLPHRMDMLSICDDFGEMPTAQPKRKLNDLQHHAVVDLDKSYGYFSGSNGNGSRSEEISTPTPSNGELRYTQEISERADSPIGPMPHEPISSNLEMEMFMMSSSQSLMPKTSSPICQRRQQPAAAADSQSYQKWSNYLQSTPAYMLHNVTAIPEAIAGHFSPPHFPAFTQLAEIESAPKRYKFDAGKHMQGFGITQTITTDL